MVDDRHSTKIPPEAFRDVPVLVTGGAGFIGSHLVRRLIGLGARVRILDDLSTGLHANIDGLDVDLIEGSILDANALGRAVEGVHHVLHQAAFVSVAGGEERPDACRRINVEGTAAVLAAARAAGVTRLVNASSAAIYGDQGDGPVSETATPAPSSEYARSKLEAERIVRTDRGGVDTISLRYFNVFGPRQRIDSAYAAVIPAFVTAACTGRPVQLHGDGLQTRDFVSCRTVVESVLAACIAEDPFDGDVCNVGTGRGRTIASVLQLVGALVGTRPDVEHVEPRIGDIRHSLADIGRATERLGVESDDTFESDMEILVDWMRQSAAC